MIRDVHSFRGHVNRVYTQFKQQKFLKENLPDNHVYIHMDFAEDYRCRSQEEIQSACWSPTQVTIHPVVMYYRKRGEKDNSHQSFVFVSNESRHDATFIYTLISKLVPLLKEIIPDLKRIHYWTDSPISQYRNKTIFKIISYHEEYFNCRASWNYMEVGHGKGPCDPIGGTAKRKADQAVKNGKFLIQDAVDFYEWSKQETSSIKFIYLSTEEYQNSQSFLKAECKNLDAVKGTFLLHAVFSLKPNWIWVRDTSCFCRNCFDQNFRKDSCCKGWRECELRTIKPRKRKNLQNSTAVNKKSITEDGNAANNMSVVEERTSSSHVTLETVEPTIGDYVGAVYEKAVYIGLVNDMDEEEAEIHFCVIMGSSIDNQNSKRHM